MMAAADGAMLLQYAIVAVAVLSSVFVVVRKYAPQTLRNGRVALARRLLREGRPVWMQALGQWIAPIPLAGGGACGGCDSCK